MMRRFNSSFSKPSLLTWLCLLSLGLATGSPLISQDKGKDKKERKKEDKERRKRQLQEEQEDYYKKWQKEEALVHESELARNEPDSQVHHLPRGYDDGLPSSAIRLRM